MKAAGVIAEFNPFHNGHAHLLAKARADLSPDALIAVMSGNFVQRGKPAIQDKFVRAGVAVRCGADLVVELPTVFAVNGAGDFAKGGIRILKGLGCAVYLVFGSETCDKERLLKAAEIAAFESPEFSDAVSLHMSKGASYPAAYEAALSDICPDLASFFASRPNDTLAREYLKENIRQDAGLIPYPVLRRGAAHDDDKPDKDGFASASHIRLQLFRFDEDDSLNSNNININNVTDYLPPPSYEAVKKQVRLGKKAQDRYFNLLRYAILSASNEDLALLLGVSEGLENSLKKAVVEAGNTDELILAVKSRRFTFTRIARILAQLLLGITKEIYEEADKNNLAYARVLAFNEKGAELLASCRSTASIPIYTNINRQLLNSVPERALIDIDIRASDIYSIISGRTIYEGSDYVQTPQIV